MVMAGTDRAPATTTDESLASRLQWLRHRREALQEKLASKNNELKNLCIDEAELTGVLPPEIPLEPGESPPAFRRRLATCFSHPHNHINRIKTNEADVGMVGRVKTNEADLGILGRLKTNEAEESSLELERQVQVNITEAALGILNDPAESKAMRRKHRSIYQQSQRRLRELDARLNFIRQAHSRIHLRPHVSTLEPSSHSTGDLTQSQMNVKHRTKKPRPPLDNLENESGSKTLPSRTILQETGINLSPSFAESHQQNHVYRQTVWNSRDYRMPLEEPGISMISGDVRNYNHGNVLPSTIDGMDRRRNPKYPENDFNDNHDLYILPDRYRPRTYSQGTLASNGVPNVCPQKYVQDSEKNYRPIPNTYTEEERLMRYRQIQHKRQNHENYNSQQPQRIPSPQKKPPVHQNYRNYPPDHHQNNPSLDNRSPQLNYSLSDEFSNRGNVRYRNFTDETNKNHGNNAQRVRSVRDSSTSGRSSKTNLPELVNSEIAGPTTGTIYRTRDNEEIGRSEETTIERFGSLDRRKYNAQCGSHNVGGQPVRRSPHDERSISGRFGGHHNSGSSIASSSSSTRDYVLGLTAATKYPSPSGIHQQNYNSQVARAATTTTTNSPSCDAGGTVARGLVRTQSLGSVENWQQTGSNPAVVGRDPRETERSPIARTDDGTAARRGREKEWYETWMDSGFSGTIPTTCYENVDHRQNLEQTVGGRQISPSSPVIPVAGRTTVGTHRSIGAPSPPPPPPSPPSSSYVSKDAAPMSNPERTVDAREIRYPRNYSQSHGHPSSPKTREIPAESKPSADIRQHGDETMTGGSERSPDLCTVVHAGKYQPYREVTKPFEMSDFYKYSTKYRKRAETVGQMRTVGQTGSSANGDDDEIGVRGARQDSGSSGIVREEGNNFNVNPVQRKIYEPVKRMTCQPYEGISGKIVGDDGIADWRTSTTSHASEEDSTVV